MKWWIGFGDNPILSRKDLTIFIVVPDDGNKDQRLLWTRFAEADDMESSRAALHAEVDKYFDHMARIAEMERVAADPEAPPDYEGPIVIGDPSE